MLPTINYIYLYSFKYTVYRVLNAMLNYFDFPDLKQIAVKRMHFQTE